MFLIWLLFLPFINCGEIRNEIVRKKVNLENQIITFTEDIQFINLGNNSVNEYTYLLDPSIEKARVHISEESIKYDNRTYLIKLPRSLLKNEKFTFQVTVYVLDELRLLDSYDTKRFIAYKGNVKYFSAYKTKLFKVTYDLMEKSEFIEAEPKMFGNKSRLFNELTNVESFSYFGLQLIYVNNAPFYYVSDLERKIDVSHFGFIMIQDKVTVINKGPKSKNPYQSVPNYTRTKLRTILPELAFDVKLFDEIGNNSKSQIYYTDFYTLLVFETRYELFTSWKTVYTLQYTVPAYHYLQRSNDVYFLEMPVVDDILPKAFIKSAKTKVYLPEDSNLISVNASEEFIELSNREVVTTALAPSREVVVFHTVDLINGLSPNFHIVYERGSIQVFKPAFYIITYLESIFLVYLFLSYVKPALGLKKC